MALIDEYYGNNNSIGGQVNQPFGGYDKSYNPQSFQYNTKESGFNNTATAKDLSNNYGMNSSLSSVNTLNSLSDSYNTGTVHNSNDDIANKKTNSSSDFNFGNTMQGGGSKALASTGDAIFSGITKKYEDKWAPKADADGIITDDRKNYQKGAMLGYAKGSSKGASLGTQIMPGWGTLIGAVVGGIGGAIMGNSKLKEETRNINKSNRVTGIANLSKELSDTRQKNDEINYNKQHSDAKLNNIFNSLNSINTDTNTSNRKYTIENGTMYNNSENGLLPVTY